MSAMPEAPERGRRPAIVAVDAGVIVELVAGGLDLDRLGAEDLAASHCDVALL
jgi:hypothetical protein